MYTIVLAEVGAWFEMCSMEVEEILMFSKVYYQGKDSRTCDTRVPGPG